MMAKMTSIMADPGNRIRAARTARQISQTELARRAAISRQALSAIESGLYQPSVSVALKLARELGDTVESLFAELPFERIEAVVAPGAESAAGTRVALGRVRGRVVAVPYVAAPRALAPAAGTIERTHGSRVAVESLRSGAEINSMLLIAGCDPAVSILADWMARHHAPVTVAAFGRGSKQALDALSAGQVHVAGAHLRHRKTGEYNLDAARRALGSRGTVLVSFGRWELGLATAPRNPHAIRGFADLGRRALKIVNRERGSGARSALDEAIHDLGFEAKAFAGYEVEVAGHLEVAEAIAAGRADAGVTLRVAAQAYGLGFVPLREERYDLAIPQREMSSTPLRAMMESLTSARFAREVATLCGYDTSSMGKIVAQLS
jgi:molybdate-binding protein/DNA-binding XRE family transcriptional regulator